MPQKNWTMAEVRRVQRMWSEGVRFEAMAEQLGRSQESVGCLMARWRKRDPGSFPPRPKPPPLYRENRKQIRVTIPLTMLPELERRADLRGVKPSMYMRQLIEEDLEWQPTQRP